MKHILLLTSLLAFVGFAVAENETPVVRTVDPELQPRIQFLNPEYLVYAPPGNTNAKLPLLIFLHGADGARHRPGTRRRVP
jgi:poly(3-hydroxybutyrate) depolymerase